MREVRIPKRRGEWRTIVVPGWAMKKKLRILGERVMAYVMRQPAAYVIHGFAPGRSPVTNALQHVGYKYTVSFDLKDFFDCVNSDLIRKHMFGATVWYGDVLYKGRAAQGLPSSPSVANAAALSMDNRILYFINNLNFPVVYTRYADDLTFSFDYESTRKSLLRCIPRIVTESGFLINKSKTRCQHYRSGFRTVTGVAVSMIGIHPTREVKRRLRAALHQGNKASTEGLREWMKLKLPKENHEEIKSE
jgi:Reverse transcriptase (RNA-dependent DNA polymerase)